MLPTVPGTYALILRSSRACTIRIGRLGTLRLRPGWYVYVGSAFGPGGLRPRIAHHGRRAQRPHWHIDYLRLYTRIEAVWCCRGARCEHQWAANIGAMPGAAVVLPGFGSSDRGCETHLYWFAEPPARYPGAGEAYTWP
jgi:Uri superfamily endonuclease